MISVISISLLSAFAESVGGAAPEVTLDVGEPLVADTCADAGERILSDTTGLIRVERWRDASGSQTLSLNIRLNFESARRARLRARATSVVLCRGGCPEQPGSECTTFEPRIAFPDAPPEVNVDSIDLEPGLYAVAVETTPEELVPGSITIEFDD
jgi:hypothetical protein